MPPPVQHGVPEVALRWLIRLRWVAFAGQSFSLWFAWRWLPVPLDLPLIAAGLATTAITNLALTALRPHLTAVTTDACGVVLALDTCTLTLMLHASGGANHPFAAFYLLHLTLAALLLVPRWVVGQLVLCLGGLAWLNFAPMNRPTPAWPAVPVELHYEGLLIALGLTGTGIAYFVSRVQADLQRSTAALRESQARWSRHERFAGLATLAAGVAHELATPLGTIAVISREMERHARNHCLSEACREDSRLIRTEVDRCRDIIARLNRESIGGETETLELTSLGAGIAAILSPAHAARLRIAAPPPGSFLRAPRPALLQSLTTLVKNACEADPAGGPVELQIQPSGPEVTFTVRDQGAGMDATTATRIGEPFFTTKEPGQGLGLGLYIVRMFAERLHGRLEIQSSPGTGTVVQLVLPRGTSRDHDDS